MSDDILKGPRKQEVRILEGKPHLCSTIGGIIIKDLGEYNTSTKKICGEPVYTAKQLEDMYQPYIEERIIQGVKKENRKIMRVEAKIKEEEVENRLKEALLKKVEEKLEKGEVDLEKELKKLEQQNANAGIGRYVYRIVGDEDISKFSSGIGEKLVEEQYKRVITKAKEEAEATNEVEKKIETPKVSIPDINIMATTNTGTVSPSGTTTITPDIKFNVTVPRTDIGIGIDKLKAKEDNKTDKLKVEDNKSEKKVEVKVDSDKTEKKVEDNRIKDDNKTKEKKEEADPYNWYINETLRLKK